MRELKYGVCITHVCAALTLTVTSLLQIYRRLQKIEAISELLF